jgi:hypothetical protein
MCRFRSPTFGGLLDRVDGSDDISASRSVPSHPLLKPLQISSGGVSPWRKSVFLKLGKP